ncbi:MAG: Rieske 2Fe-2S domain-containing protein [Proteobacteria bacterium]|nr:Rieske 2Fe-2S domain-containing protein [Pseudomonadota bacterium]
MSNDLIYLCDLDRLSDPGSFGFCVERNEQEIEGFLVKNDNRWFAYRNSCPHTGSPLDWVEHQFLYIDGALILCSTHDALFVIDTGECVVGPCLWECLEKLDIVVQGDGVYLSG